MVKLAAHRGYMSDYPENTMLAYRKALELDIDQIEMDIHMTKDGELICMHDALVDRTTNGSGLVREKTLSEMLALDAGCKKSPAFAGEKVPLFREFLELMDTRPEIEMNIELKDYPHESGEFAFRAADKAVRMIEEFGIRERIYINSWSGEMLAYLADTYHDRYRLHGYYPPYLMKGSFDPEGIYRRLFCACLFHRTPAPDGSLIRHKDERCPTEWFEALAKKVPEVWIHYSEKEDTEENLRYALERGTAAFTCNDPKSAGILLDKIGARKLKKQ